MSCTRNEAEYARAMLGRTGVVNRVAAIADVYRGEDDPYEWIVSSLDAKGDGGIYLTVFSGPLAKERALEYAAEKYSGLQLHTQRQR